MARIDRAIIEAAVDAGANAWQVLREVVIPLSKSGMALGSIFVVTLVMGDFFVVKIMSGGQSASVVLAMSNEIALAVSSGSRERGGAHADGDADGRGHPAPGGCSQRAFWLVLRPGTQYPVWRGEIGGHSSAVTVWG